MGGLALRRGRWVPLLLASGALMAITTASVQAGRVGRAERAAFRVVNELPDNWRTPTWLVMQLGSFGGVPISVTAALLARRPRLAVRLAVAGTAAYLLPKPWKHAVGRDRPAVLLDGVVRRDDSVGLGFPSGHAAVSTALALTAAAYLPRGSWAVLTPLVAVVAAGRVYVGAHLPLDLVGGAALGALVAAAVGVAADAAEAGAGRRATARPAAP